MSAPSNFKITRAAVIAVSFFLIGFRAEANIFERDDREYTMPAPGEPLAAIGRLVNSVDLGAGTAFLVGRCHIMTNFHVALSNEEMPDLNEISHFTLGQSRDVVARIIEVGRFVPGSKNENLEDWALLKLDDCLGDKYGWLELYEIDHRQVSARKTNVIMAGYPSDLDSSRLSLDPQCRIHPEILRDRSGWRHDCASRPGSSGSPILLGDKVVALNSAQVGDFAELFKFFDVHFGNAAVPVGRFIDRVQYHLRLDNPKETN